MSRRTGGWCGQTQPHGAHGRCGGHTGAPPVLPGPCFADGGFLWPGIEGLSANVRCELTAGHDGAHQGTLPFGGSVTFRTAVPDGIPARDPESGWYAAADPDNGGEWMPCYDTGHGYSPSFQAWFKTQAECEAWIAENVIGAGWAPGEPSS